MQGPDPEAVVQHDWVAEEWEEPDDGESQSETYCQNCFKVFDHYAPFDEEFYSACPEYEGDGDGDQAQADDSE